MTLRALEAIMFRDRAIKMGLAVALAADAAPVRAADQPQSQSVGPVKTATTPERSPSDVWTVPDVGSLPPGRWGRHGPFGSGFTTETYAHIGPEVADPAKRFAGSDMACQSCHLEAGTKKFGLPFVGVFADFPQYRAREGEVGMLEDRINGCMTRSLNGKALPIDSPEMKAFVAYIKFLSDGRPIGRKTPGRGSGKMEDWRARPIPSSVGRFTNRTAPAVTERTARASEPAPSATPRATCSRRFGAPTASTTEPAWAG